MQKILLVQDQDTLYVNVLNNPEKKFNIVCITDKEHALLEIRKSEKSIRGIIFAHSMVMKPEEVKEILLAVAENPNLKPVIVNMLNGPDGVDGKAKQLVLSGYTCSDVTLLKNLFQ
ncbi:MAG: hypothetical protein WCP92_09250 [bacterium]